MNDYLDLDALADGQLEGEAKAAAEARIRCCEKSRAHFEAVRQLKVGLSTKCEPIMCEETWSKCRDRLREIDRAKKVEGFVGRYAWGLCGVFLLAIVVGGSLNRTSGAVRPGDVARISASMSPLPFAGSRTSEDRPKWFDGIMPPMKIEPEKVQIVGAASGMVNGHRVGKVSLVDPTGPMALFMFENTERIEDGNANDQGFSLCTVGGSNAVGWSENPHAYLLIGDRPFDDLQIIAHAIRGK